MVKRAVILILIGATGVALYLFSDLESLSSAILSMSGTYLLFLLLLLLGNEIVKGWRWAYLLRASGLDISLFDGITSYLGSQAATAIPGGSLLGARLAREHGNMRTSEAVSGFVGQAVADLWGVSALAVAGILLTQQRHIQLLIPGFTLIASAVLIAVVRSSRLRNWTFSVARRWKITRRFLPDQEGFLTRSAALMRPKTLLTTTCFSIASTAMAAVMLLIIVRTLTVRGMSFDESIYTHSVSILTRMAVPIPGGYGVSDISLTGMLNFIGIGLARAAFIAIAVRSIGLIFRTCLGLLVLIVRYPAILIGPLGSPQATAVEAQQLAQRRQLSWVGRLIVAIRFRGHYDQLESGRPNTHTQQQAHVPAQVPPQSPQQSTHPSKRSDISKSHVHSGD